MKIKKFFGGLAAALLLVQYSCKEDQLDFHSGADAIYFSSNETRGRIPGTPSEYYSFGYVSADVDHYIKKIPVITTGRLKDYDREYKVQVSDTSTMVLGKDFEFLNERFFIPANKVTDTIYLKINRSPKLSKKILSVGIELIANSNFTTELNRQILGTGDNKKIISFTGYNFSADDMAGAPWFWNLQSNPQRARATINYLGDYSAKKLQLILARFELDVQPMLEIGYFPSGAMFNTWGNGMKSYFTEMANKGTPVLEEDGTPMKMGILIR